MIKKLIKITLLTMLCLAKLVAMEENQVKKDFLYNLLNEAWHEGSVLHPRCYSPGNKQWQAVEYMVFNESDLAESIKKEVYKKFYNDVLRNAEMSNDHKEISDEALDKRIKEMPESFEIIKKCSPAFIPKMENKMKEKVSYVKYDLCIKDEVEIPPTTKSTISNTNSTETKPNVSPIKPIEIKPQENKYNKKFIAAGVAGTFIITAAIVAIVYYLRKLHEKIRQLEAKKDTGEKAK